MTSIQVPVRHIRLIFFRNQVRDNQEYTKTELERRQVYKQLLFLTSSQTIPGRSCSNYDNSSLAPGSEEYGGDSSVTTDSIFTHDVQINWSAVTARQLEQLQDRVR